MTYTDQQGIVHEPQASDYRKARPIEGGEQRPGVVQTRGLLRGAGPGLRRFQWRRHRRPARPDRQAGLPGLAGRRLPVAAAVLRFPAARRRLRHLRLPQGAARVRHRRRLRCAARRRPRARHPGDRRPGDEPHLRRPPVVPGVPPAPGRAVRRLLRLARRRHRLPGRQDHLRRHRAQQLDLRPGPQAVFLAPVLLPPAGPELREPGRRRRDDRFAAVLAGPGAGRFPAGRRPVPVRGGRHQRREPAQDPRIPQALPQGARRRVPQCHPAGRGQSMAGGCRRLLRRPGGRRRRMPHVLPLPADAADLHGGQAGTAVPDLGDPGADAGHPGERPVGHLPAQPRRAHARDGQRRGPRLHVERVRQGPADEGQHRHPPPAGHPAGERHQPAGTVHRHAAEPARVAGAVLRRRDRDGRQHLAGRPGRRARPRCSGHRTATPGSPAATRPGCTCRRSWTRSTASRRSMSRRR